MPENLKAGYEGVYSVLDYYDGPRRGIADFEGRPHLYESLFDSQVDEYSEIYLLTPVNQEILQLAMEYWETWTRWRAAFDKGKATRETHPALPIDRMRHDELKVVLDKVLVSDHSASTRAKAKFLPPGESGRALTSTEALQVRWTTL